MADENLLATLEQSLRQARGTRARLSARLTELETEAEKVRAELAEMDTLTSQTEAAMFRLLSSVLAPPSHAIPSDAQLEAALRQDAARSSIFSQSNALRRDTVPRVRTDIEAKSERFADRTIPQATALLLREASGPLHVNEIYNRLLAGGFHFTGQNPTISIAVSLNRNNRFRKVAPGTFDLMIRDASQAF